MNIISFNKQTKRELNFTPVSNGHSTMSDTILHSGKEQNEFAPNLPHRVVKALSIILVGSGLFWGGTSQSYASDSKVYPGAMCVRWNAGVDPDPVLSYSKLYNSSRSRELRVDCPVVKDRNDNVYNAWVRLTDQHTTRNICPQLVGYKQVHDSRRNTDSVWFRSIPSSPRCTEGSSRSMKSFIFGSLTSLPEDAHVYISIRIPPAQLGRSGIGSYRVRENTGNIFNSRD